MQVFPVPWQFLATGYNLVFAGFQAIAMHSCLAPPPVQFFPLLLICFMFDAKQVLSQLQEVVPTSIIYISCLAIMCPNVINNNHDFL